MVQGEVAGDDDSDGGSDEDNDEEYYRQEVGENPDKELFDKGKRFAFGYFFNHRAKQGGSLFEGSSGKEERSRSDPPPGGRSPPPRVAKRPLVC